MAVLVKADEPELCLVHRRLDTWAGLGVIVIGVERQGLRFSLSHIAEGEWQAYFMASPMFARAGFGVAETPWQAVQQCSVGGGEADRMIQTTHHRVDAG